MRFLINTQTPRYAWDDIRGNLRAFDRGISTHCNACGYWHAVLMMFYAFNALVTIA